MIDEEAFLRRFNGELAAAYTLPETKEICFNSNELNIRVVRHELGHAYYDSLCVGSANLTVDQSEEIWCDILAERGPEIMRLAKKLHAELKKLL
jgi:hypothetical protein